MKKKKKKSKKRYKSKRIKLKRKFRKVKIKRNKKRKKSPKRKKNNKTNFKPSFIKLKPKKFKISILKKHQIKLKTFTFQKIINYILQPIFKSYTDFVEKRRLERLQKIAFEKREKEKQLKEEERLREEAKQKELKDEIKFAKERSEDLKRFIKEGQALLRKEQAEKKRKFLQQIKLEKKIEAFRKRELLEIRNLEKIALREKILEFKPIQDRIEEIKNKYKKIREQKIKERIESLGIEVLDSDTKEELLQKEKEYSEQRQKIETILESFYRSANSLVFQLNKRYIPKHKSILRVIDRRYEENLCFIRYDDSPDDDYLMLIYLEDSNPSKENIVVEDKTNEEKHVTKTFKTSAIFSYSDYLVDQFTAHLDREFKKKKAS